MYYSDLQPLLQLSQQPITQKIKEAKLIPISLCYLLQNLPVYLSSCLLLSEIHASRIFSSSVYTIQLSVFQFFPLQFLLPFRTVPSPAKKNTYALEQLNHIIYTEKKDVVCWFMHWSLPHHIHHSLGLQMEES